MRLAGFLPPVSTRMAAPLSQRLIFLRANELLSWNTAKTALFAANKDAFAHLWPDFYLHCYYEQCNYTLLHFGAINSNEIIHGKYPLSFFNGKIIYFCIFIYFCEKYSFDFAFFLRFSDFFSILRFFSSIFRFFLILRFFLQFRDVFSSISRFFFTFANFFDQICDYFLSFHSFFSLIHPFFEILSRLTIFFSVLFSVFSSFSSNISTYYYH